VGDHGGGVGGRPRRERADANAFYNRLADEIAAACDDGRVPCVSPHLEGWSTRWMDEGCSPPLAEECQYPGGFFVWVLREATWQTGHGDTAAEAQAFLGRLADEIHAACDDGRVPCTAPGIAAMPPWSRVDKDRLWPSAHRLTSYLFAFEV
jgi:hypothetical protein